jgi:hypothetical protein
MKKFKTTTDPDMPQNHIVFVPLDPQKGALVPPEDLRRGLKYLLQIKKE